MRRTRLFVLLTIAVLVLAALACGESGGTPQPTRTPGPTKPPTDTPAPTATPTPAPEAPPYMEIRDKFDAMTEAQWKAYVPTLKGNTVTDWVGWIENVDKVPLSAKYALYIDIDDPDVLLSIYDVVIPIPESEALTYNKDTRVRFSGTIESVTTLLGSLTVNVMSTAIEVLP